MKIIKTVLILIILAIIIFSALIIIYITPKKYYTAEDFNIETIKSSNDENQNGVDDFTDIMLGARQDAINKPKYKSAYYSGGYPPETEGVCTDLVWRAFKYAGFSLKDLVDQDIAENTSEYHRVEDKPDPNIDFRRVPNLKVFFDRNAKILTTDLTQIEQWQPGDIVIFKTDHIGIISDKRNKRGIPYLIHNTGQPYREEDVLEILNKFTPITGHYRWEV